MDQHGNLAAATSTGGVTNKNMVVLVILPLLEQGLMLKNGNVAVSTTGMGEYFIRKTVAGDVAARMRYLKEEVSTASDAVIQGELKTYGWGRWFDCN
ncbi:isoaspartyl peptidase/L-asparaginase [Vibrio sinaloensis]|nr:isoaspartyl peptidase/L-asparaginase [Vibrio sinaloensis]